MPRETSLYDEDFYRWTQHQAALLRTENGRISITSTWQRS